MQFSFDDDLRPSERWKLNRRRQLGILNINFFVHKHTGHVVLTVGPITWYNDMLSMCDGSKYLKGTSFFFGKRCCT